MFAKNQVDRFREIGEKRKKKKKRKKSALKEFGRVNKNRKITQVTLN